MLSCIYITKHQLKGNSAKHFLIVIISLSQSHQWSCHNNYTCVNAELWDNTHQICYLTDGFIWEQTKLIHHTVSGCLSMDPPQMVTHWDHMYQQSYLASYICIHWYGGNKSEYVYIVLMIWVVTMPLWSTYHFLKMCFHCVYHL